MTRGRFGGKRVVAVRWTGSDRFAEAQQADAKLTEMLKEVMLREGEIRVDPLDDHIRIYGEWVHEDAFEFNQTMLEIANMIARHIKAKLRPPGDLSDLSATLFMTIVHDEVNFNSRRKVATLWRSSQLSSQA